MPLSIVDALLPDGTITSVRVVDGLVASVGAPASPGDEVVRADGRLLLPAMAEPHAHLDKAFLAEVVPNPAGDLMGAIEAMDTHRHLITRADTEARAERAARLLVANGTTAIRTHADLVEGNESVRALLAVRDRLRDLVHIEVVALAGTPLIGPAGAPQRDLLLEAVELGVDLVGACPHLEDDPDAVDDLCLELASAHGLPIDLHTDETLDPTRFALPHLARRVLDSGFPHQVTASHCVSLGMQSPAVQREVAELVAEAGIGVVALPSSNLYLQGRDRPQAMPRGITAVGALRAAGVVVAAGADNLQDPFNLVGRGDCLETAALMVMAAHLLPDDAYHATSSASRAVMGLPEAGPVVGAAGDFVLLHARWVREAVALAPSPRTVVRAGRVVAGA